MEEKLKVLNVILDWLKTGRNAKFLQDSYDFKSINFDILLSQKHENIERILNAKGRKQEVLIMLISSPPEFFYARDEYKEKALELIDDNEDPQVIDEIFLEIIDDKKKN